MKIHLIILCFLFAIGVSAQNNVEKVYNLNETTRYSQLTGHGYDFVATPQKNSNAPFFYSIKVPDGNYVVTVKLGSKKKSGNTTVRAENRRLFVANQITKKGQFVEKTFIVNKREPKISDTEAVKIKEREKDYLTWDDRLTLEFNGEAPACESISIKSASDSVVTLFLCGNSTVVDQRNEPWASWGQMITHFMDNNVAIANYAESGETASSFLARKRLDKALSEMKKGDYVFMEFGHNDQKEKGQGKGAYSNFVAELKTMIDQVREKGAYPVLVTPTSRRHFDEKGNIINTHGEYPDAVRWLAAKENVPLIELNLMTKSMYEALGVDNSTKAFVHYPANTFPGQTKALADNTHFSTYGAYQVAKCVLQGIIKAQLPIEKYILPDYRTYNPSQPDDFATFHWDLSPFFEKEKPDGN